MVVDELGHVLDRPPVSGSDVGPVRAGGGVGSVMRVDPAALTRAAQWCREQANKVETFDTGGLKLTARQVGDRGLAAALTQSAAQRRAELKGLVANLRSRAAALDAAAASVRTLEDAATARLRSVGPR